MDAQHPLVVALDVAVGWVLLIGGVLVWRGQRPAGTLLALTGACWLVSFAWPAALFWHRGPLVHLLLALPGWRPRTAPALGAVAAGYVVSVVTPVVWTVDGATLALGLGLVAAAAWNVRNRTGTGKHHARRALVASLVLGGALLLGGAARLVGETWGWLVALAAYDAALVGVVALLVVWSSPARVATLRDLVIDLGDAREHPSRDALARTLRDPDLVVAVWDPDRAAYVTADGEPVTDAAPGRGTTRVDRDGSPSVLLVHDEALEGDRRLTEALEAAARMDAANAAGRDEVALRARAVSGSRLRLLAAADDERRRLAQDLARGVQARLGELLATLTEHGGAPGGHLGTAVDHLVRTRQELDELAAGLRPRDLAAGLEEALRRLAASVPLDVEVTYDAGSLSADAELAAYYVCSEAVVNAAKHARGAHVAVSVTEADAVLRIAAVDDGPGGAGFAERGGLLGLRDRVEALGGRLALASDATGTRVAAELPLDRDPR